MIEIFELIAKKPLEMLAGLGISASTIYAIIKILASIFKVITKKSTIKKELEYQNSLSKFLSINLINELGGISNIINQIAQTVLNSSQFTKLTNDINYLIKNSKCPIEMEAYIQTILNQQGNEDLALLYEQVKSALIEREKSSAEEIVKEEVIEEIKPQNEITEDTKESDLTLNDTIIQKEESVEYA